MNAGRSWVIMVAGTVCLVMLWASGQAQELCFDPAINYAAGGWPRSVVATDLDGDGDLDLTVANAGDGCVSALKNYGSGSFGLVANYAVGNHPLSMHAADLDGDGDQDLATANAYSHNVSVLKNNGDWNFAAAVNYSVGSSPWSVFAADLDGDGDRDLTVANFNGNDVSILKNSGDGTYVAAVNYPTGVHPISVLAADLDGDGDRDLAVANYTGNDVSVLKNGGDGTYAAAVNYLVGAYPMSVYAADLDGDGDQDLATANHSGSVSVLKNNGDATFAPTVDFAASSGPSSIFAADLDWDGDRDLAVANDGEGSNNVSILKNNGDGSFTAPANYVAGNFPYSVFADDLDGDGDPDLAVGNLYSGTVSVLRNCFKGSVDFSATPRSGDPPLTVFFTGKTDTIVDRWTWHFGDGDSATIQNPVHLYSSPGKYAVSLEAVVGARTISITRQAYIHVNSMHADFRGMPRAGVRPLEVSFIDLSTGSPTAWAWEFGDGGSATVPNPSHIYLDTGWFAVTLRVAKAGGSDSVRCLNHIRVDTVALPDIEVNVYGNIRPRPGFIKGYHVRVRNLGVSSTSGDTLRFAVPTQTTYNSSAPPGSVSGNTVKWVLPLLSPGESPLDYQVWVNIPMGIPAGTALLATASADTALGEIMCANNHRSDSEQVVVSIDPNEKLVQPTGCGPNNDLIRTDERLTYTIFFENKPEATAEAIYVLVVDTLDPDLDWGTLQVGPTIKDAVLQFDVDPFSGELRWFFDGINLPPNVNPPEGEGFVSYTILPKQGLPNGTMISNRAHIRFDYNEWIAAPGSGALELTVQPCPCDCPRQGDIAGRPSGDGVIDVFDIIEMIGIAFSGDPDPQDPNCHRTRGDVDNNGVTDVFDVIYLIATAFSGGPSPVDPCAL